MMRSMMLLLAMSALLLTTPLFALEGNDPCEEIPGHWIGTWRDKINKCTQDADVQGTRLDKDIRLQVKLSDSPDSVCKEVSFVLQGKCVDSKLHADGFKGRVYSGFMNLWGYGNEVQLNKQ